MSVWGGAGRRRRVLLWGAGGLLLVIGVAVLIAMPAKKPSRLRTASEGVTTTSEASGDSTTSVTDADVSTTTAPAAGDKPTTSTVRRTTTTSRPSTTTTEVPQCTAADLDGTTATDKASYPSGHVVTVTVRLRNHSDHVCNGPTGYFRENPVSITDQSGATVWTPPGGPPGLGTMPEPNPVAPGATYTYATVQWDQHTCDAACGQDMHGGKEGGLVPPGSYTAHGTFSGGDAGRINAGQAAFTVTASG